VTEPVIEESSVIEPTEESTPEATEQNHQTNPLMPKNLSEKERQKLIDTAEAIAKK
jgi:hypothetical protein